MFSSRAPIFAAALIFAAGAIRAPIATAAEAPSEPQISVRAMGEVKSTAAKADFSVGITTQLPNSVAAAAENVKTTKAVTEALAQAKLPGDAILSNQSTVSPIWSYSALSGKRSRTGYSAVTTLSIETRELDRLGSFLDAALNAGATDISSISFSSADPEAMQREAATEAVRKARRDAEAIAAAAGGSLGRLVRFSNVPGGARTLDSDSMLEEIVVTGQRRAAQSVDIGTQVVIPQITTTATVYGVWQFVPR